MSPRSAIAAFVVAIAFVLASPLLAQSADLTMNKTAPGSGTPGQSIGYTLDVLNNGPNDAANVVITDVLPAGVTFQLIIPPAGFSCTTPAVGAGGTVTCSAATLMAGGGANMIIGVQIAPSASGIISNTGSVSSATSDPTPGNNQSTASTTVLTSVDLAATNSPSTVAITPGQTITYTYSFTNNGPSTAVNMTGNNTVPAHTTYVSSSQTSGPAFSCVAPSPGGTGTVACSIASFPSGATAGFTLTVLSDLAIDNGAVIIDTATAASSTLETNPANNSANADTTVSSSADVSITKSAPGGVIPGQNITYTITVSNSGPDFASTVVLSDDTPANTTFVSATQTSGPAFVCTDPGVGNTGTIQCTLDSFPIGSATFQFVVQSDGALGNGVPISNTATVTDGNADPTPGDNSSTAVTTTTTNVADLSITKTAPATVFIGQSFAYSISIANGGPNNATNVTGTDVLPPGLVVGTIVMSQGSSSVAGNVVTLNFGTVNNGAGATATINVTPTATGTLVNTASVGATEADSNPANNTSQASTIVMPLADLSITKVLSAGGGPYVIGSQIQFLITVTNGGPSPATNVTVTDPLPAGATFVSAVPSQGSCSGTTTVTCTLGTLANGASATITLKMRAPSLPGPISNTATVSANESDPTPGNNSSTAAVTILAAGGAPTLSFAALMAMALLLATAGLIALRR
ncbi:MAG TPA: hypothetical protein VEZ11_09645 [Thermoanaerobaculia bacterium]|nr:hypothetical protein [Thermoanaerobaculia bacterium]